MVAAEVPAFRMRWTVPNRVQLEVRDLGIRAERRGDERIRVLVGRLYAEERGAVGVIATDHVAVQHRDDLRLRYHRVADEPTRAEEAAFFGALPNEEDWTRRGVLHERARRGKHRDADARVVVGAVP